MKFCLITYISSFNIGLTIWIFNLFNINPLLFYCYKCISIGFFKYRLFLGVF